MRILILAAMNRAAALFLLCLTLSACAVVDLAAHGIKEYEDSRGQGAPQAADQSQPLSQAAPPTVDQRIQPAETRSEPIQSVPPRESVDVEGLK